jgi:hypothetical protein
MTLTVIAAIGVIVNGIVAQVLAFELAKDTASALHATVSGMVSVGSPSVPPPG